MKPTTVRDILQQTLNKLWVGGGFGMVLRGFGLVVAVLIAIGGGPRMCLGETAEPREPFRYPDAGTGQAVWHFDNLESIAGHPVTVEGDPHIIETPNGKAIEFDGVDDGIFLDVNPLTGISEFTVEVIFKPGTGGAPEQRFFHMQEGNTADRVMFETRLVEDRDWFLDTFIKSGDQKIPLYAENNLHRLNQWHHAAIVVDGTSFTHYVNGQKELSEPIDFKAMQAGRMSLGVRLNRVNWFRGAIRTARFTPRALAPEEFLTATD